MKKLQFHSIADTNTFAETLAEKMKGQSALLLMEGDLGAGKTTFTKAFGKAMGVKKTINSPTFTILKSYVMGDGRMLHHIDAYRMEGITQDLGFEEIFDEDAICVVEWPAYISSFLPQEYLRIQICSINETEREVELCAKGTFYERIVEEL